MTGDDYGGDIDDDQPRVPGPLRERVHELFVAERGYEPASFQEALGVVVDLASDVGEDGHGTPREASEHESSRSLESGSPSTTTSDRTVDGDASDVANDEQDPDHTSTSFDAAVDDTAFDTDDGNSVSFDEYVDGLEETRQNPPPAVESILDTGHADAVVRELAEEVLEEMTQEAFRELEHGVDHGVGASVADGMGSTETVDGSGTAPSDSTGDGVPDSLTADPTSDCAVCGRPHPVSVLHTTILEDEGSVALVCPSCTE